MGTGRHVIEQLPAYALGALPEGEREEIFTHLRECADCRAELQAYQGVAGQLIMASPEIAPPPVLKTRLMEQVRAASPAAGLSSPASQKTNLFEFLRRSAPAWSLASLALAVVLLVASFLFWQRSNPSGLENSLPVVAMSNTEHAPQAHAVLVMSRDSRKGTLVVDGLPWLGEEQQYQLWLIKNSDRTSGGVFSVSQDGYGYLRIASPGPMFEFEGFGVTVEPAGGSLGPTGPQVLFAIQD